MSRILFTGGVCSQERGSAAREGGCLVLRGVPGPRGVCSWGGAWSGGVPGPGGVCSWGCVWWGPPGTGTAAGGTHPTGMHSCITFNLGRCMIPLLPVALVLGYLTLVPYPPCTGCATLN